MFVLVSTEAASGVIQDFEEIFDSLLDTKNRLTFQNHSLELGVRIDTDNLLGVCAALSNECPVVLPTTVRDSRSCLRACCI